MPGKKNVPAAVKIKARILIDPETQCWNWQGAKDRHGYGRTCINAKHLLAHRVSYEAFVGKIPAGLFLDHLCRNPSCCNPAHLEPVTNQENLLRGVRKSRQTHCKNGHPLSGDNLYISARGSRQCLTCQRAMKLEWWHRNHVAKPRKPKTHCPHGHALEGYNLMVVTVKQYGKPVTRRLCRECHNAKHRRLYQRRRDGS